MPLQSGTRLGPYEIAAQIGVGGMGEVYQATDTKLKRQVAIKVLPESVAADAERLARFQREAEVLAALNHPHIAAIYGLEDADGSKALVMELVEGPTLADRIADGAIPIDEALAIAKQIAEALEAAHEQGIIHRDLKPANVKVREDGTVKVLDFGLAKAMAPAGAMSASASMSPTITTPAMTEMGMILGTAAYMAPEQAKGKVVDRRADVWAFGVVLYEMLTGQRAFDGEDTTEVLGAVVRLEPNWEVLPTLPPLLDTFLRQCFKKDPKQRLADMQDMRLALEGAFETTAVQAAETQVVPASPPSWQRALPWAAGLALAAFAAVTAWNLKPAAPRPVIRSVHVLPAERNFRNSGRLVVAVSPDGQHFAYNATGGLYLRRLDAVEDVAILGAESSLVDPVFSPNGQSVAFTRGVQGGGGELVRLPVTGGVPLRLAQTPSSSFGLSWESDGTILYGLSNGIWQVSENGDEPPQHLVMTEPDERASGPQRLPGGDWVLFGLARGADSETRWDEAEIVVASPASDDRHVLPIRGGGARYLPSGHIVYAIEGVLYAVPFDVDRLEVTGGPVSVLQGVRRSSVTGAAHYAVTTDGMLVYVPGSATSNAARGLVWRSLDGPDEAVGTPPQSYRSLSLSPDGLEAALEIGETDSGSDVWVTELSRRTLTPITTEDGFDGHPLWHPDGQRVVYTAIRDGRVELRSMASDGTGEAETLARFDETVANVRAHSWSPDGLELAFSFINPGSGNANDIGLLSVDGAGDWKPLIDTAADETQPVISPDGRWIAYRSNEADETQIYVQRYPGLGAKQQVSVGSEGHHRPTWLSEGVLLYTRGGPPNAVVRATVGEDAAGGPVIGPEEPFVDDYPYWAARPSARVYDISPDGDRLLVIVSGAQTDTGESQPQITIVQNWFEELKRLVPVR